VATNYAYLFLKYICEKTNKKIFKKLFSKLNKKQYSNYAILKETLLSKVSNLQNLDYKG